jgi:lipoate-protein ligase A
VEPARAVWWFEVEGPAVALGSTQRLEVVNAAEAARRGVEVVRRRSGGGAVWLEPGAVTWVDVVLPAGEPEWVDDVGRAAGWLGRAWAAALEAVGVAGAEVHDGPMVRTPWSDLVCFAGMAPGEVTVAGRKVVGISQRRTREAARFQCAVLHEWDPVSLLSVLALGADQRSFAAGQVAEVAAGVGAVDPGALVAALVAALDRPA